MSLVLLGPLAGCGCVPAAPPASVLTLAPAGMESTGEVRALPTGGLCLQPGATADATVYVYRPTARMTVTLVASAGVPGWGRLRIALGGREVEVVGSWRKRQQTFRIAVAGGDQRLRLESVEEGADEVCVEQVALSQP